MFSFYIFEHSHWSGANVCECLDVFDDWESLRRHIPDVLRDDCACGLVPSPDSDFVIRVYQHGVLVLEHDIQPRLSVKIPGFTEATFPETPEAVKSMARTPRRDMVGGRRQPDGTDASTMTNDPDYEDDLEYVWVEAVIECAENQPEDLEIAVDWRAISIPELVAPVLPDGTAVVVEGRTLTFGCNSTM